MTRKNAADDRIRKAAREGDWQRTWRELIRAGHAPGVVADGELGYRGYSKFSTKGAEILHEWALDGHDVVTSENNGWAGLIEADGDSLEEDRQEAFLQALESNDEQRGEQLVIEESEAEEWEGAVGAIVRVMDSGAVYTTTYTNEKDMEDEWAEVALEVEPETCSHHDCDTTTEDICQDCEAITCPEHLYEVEEPDHPADTLWVCGDCLSARGGTQYDSEGADA